MEFGGLRVGEEGRKEDEGKLYIYFLVTKKHVFITTMECGSKPPGKQILCMSCWQYTCIA